MFETVAIVGATGAVGTIIRELLEQRKFPCRRIKFLASGRSAGKALLFAGRQFLFDPVLGYILEKRYFSSMASRC